MRKGRVPIVVDLGQASRKKIRQLVEGRGPLTEDVSEAVSQVREQLGPEAADKELVPVVIVYSRKRRKDRSLLELLL